MVEVTPLPDQVVDNLERPNCPLCGADERRPLFTGPRFAPYGVAACTACGFRYLSPRPSEAAMLAFYKQDDYFEGADGLGYEGYSTMETAMRVTFGRLLGLLDKRGLSGGRLLEIGCGYGYLLAEAAAYFQHLSATDYSQAAVAKARRYADDVYCGGPAATPVDARYDFIIANHVIEHVYQPHEFVKTLAAKLQPGGRMLLATPDAGSFWLKLLGHRWPSFKLPEHILYFDKAALTRLLVAAGLTQISQVPYPHAFPLPLVAAKLGLTLPAFLGRFSLWLPKTTLALIAFKPTA